MYLKPTNLYKIGTLENEKFVSSHQAMMHGSFDTAKKKPVTNHLGSSKKGT
jgi:hypothetical protein